MAAEPIQIDLIFELDANIVIPQAEEKREEQGERKLRRCCDMACAKRKQKGHLI